MLIYGCYRETTSNAHLRTLSVGISNVLSQTGLWLTRGRLYNVTNPRSVCGTTAEMYHLL